MYSNIKKYLEKKSLNLRVQSIGCESGSYHSLVVAGTVRVDTGAKADTGPVMAGEKRVALQGRQWIGGCYEFITILL